MKTIFLSYAYPPLNLPRAVQVARLVKHLRIRPLTVVCADTGKGAGGPSDEAAGVAVVRLPRSPVARLSEWIGRLPWRDRILVPDAFRPWAMDAARFIGERLALSSEDVLVTFGQPMSDHLAGLELRNTAGARWIAHFSDPWVDNPFRRDGVLSRRRNARLEAAVIETADRVIFTSEETEQLVMARYPKTSQSKCRVLGHAYDPALYPESKSHWPGSPLIIRHLGSFYGERSPDCLIRPLQLLLDRRPNLAGAFRVELIGPNARKDAERAAGALPGGVLAFQPPVDYAESLRLMVEADALLVIDAPVNSSVFLPSKLIDYVGAGRPIIAVTPPGTSARLVARIGGEVADPRAPDEVASAIGRLIDGLRSGRLPQDQEAAQLRASFKAENIAQSMEGIVRELLDRRPKEALVAGSELVRNLGIMS